MSGLQNFSQSEYSPDRMKLHPIQSWSANLKSCILILPHEAKELLELFYLSSNTIGRRQAKYFQQFKAKYFQQSFCPMRQTRQCLLAFPKRKRKFLSEMSGLWNFSDRVQPWSDEIESDQVLIRKIFENDQSDPVLIHPCKIMSFYFAWCGKSTTEAILTSAKYDWLKAK